MKRKSKKVNPRRIPLPRSAFDPHEFLAENHKRFILEAWILIVAMLVEADPDTDEYLLQDYWESICKYTSNREKSRELLAYMNANSKRIYGYEMPKNIVHTEQLTNIAAVASAKKKLLHNCRYVALCTVLTALCQSGKISESDAKILFVGADVTEAEIEHGVITINEVVDKLEQSKKLLFSEAFHNNQ